MSRQVGCSGSMHTAAKRGRPSPSGVDFMSDHGNVGGAGILVKELEPGLLKDYLRFFDSEAFTDNESWSGCYCGFFDDPCPDQDWDAGVESGSAHRMARIDRIRKGLARGLLAYSNGKPIGWCN